MTRMPRLAISRDEFLRQCVRELILYSFFRAYFEIICFRSLEYFKLLYGSDKVRVVLKSTLANVLKN